jgi:hypothetical protein
MRTDTHDLGRCPNCAASVGAAHVLIRYDTAEGSKAYAECPDCREVVHPRPG